MMLCPRGMEEAMWFAVNADSRSRLRKTFGDAYEDLCVPTIEQAMEYEEAERKAGRSSLLL